ncbi:c-type cytochrome biogenesis protein CcmI [Pseudodonghicola flavimaris]|uniref:C-type cytochrome biogenesis protein CcmI n=1 Tax=Pseudodonghicola flavimaris TaxID=3050036 RepID=A0ABT7F7D1_9RHOB|nr:c-type cytochrome biogenesis protein CcmI [Pseudodonghicola flavimaris]MDK3020530.1 c-type cytochrome biogenesis protein CcmI [Pseudodonghicola flavimaris]
MTFWIITTLMALAAAALLVLAMMRSRAGAGPAAAYDMQVYRDQLKEIDRDLARGVIGQEDADRLRTEVSRRILSADAALRGAGNGDGQPAGATAVMAVALAVLVIGGSILVYRALGAPGYGDLGLQQRIAMAAEARKSRPDQTAAEARMPAQPAPELEAGYQKLIDQLRSTVAARPDDLRGHDLLAQHEANIGNFKAAYAAKARVLELKGDAATAKDYGDYAELLVMAAGGYVSPTAEQALGRALKLDPNYGPARYYWGLMMAQTGRPDVAFGIWEETLRMGPPDGYWIAPIRGQIEELASLAGVRYSLPPAAGGPMMPGPSAADVEATRDMSDADRQEMIQGMVGRLSDRLASEGGSPAEWARLIGALGVLGQTDRARAIYQEALQTFASDTQALTQIEAAARNAGIAE